MKIEDVQIVDPVELLALIRPPDKPRHPGLHLSDVTKRILRKLNPTKYTEGPDKPYFLWESGFLWEEIWAMAMRSRATRSKLTEDFGVSWPQEETCMDGIWLTVDTIGITAELIWEFKWTRATASRPIDDSIHIGWHMHDKAYCRAWGVRRCNTVVWYDCGNYKDKRDPLPKLYRLRYTDDEVENNWRVILAEAKEMGHKVPRRKK